MATPRKKPEERLKMGRPTKYRPEMCARVIEIGRDGFTKAMIARDLDIAIPTLDEWIKAYPDFSAAMTRAINLAKAFMEEKGLSGLGDRNFNSGLYAKIMAARFPDEYRENRHVIDHRSSDGSMSPAGKSLADFYHDHAGVEPK